MQRAEDRVNEEVAQLQQPGNGKAGQRREEESAEQGRVDDEVAQLQQPGNGKASQRQEGQSAEQGRVDEEVAQLQTQGFGPGGARAEDDGTRGTPDAGKATEQQRQVCQLDIC